MEAERRVILEEEELGRMISRMAHEIIEKNGGADGMALIGIRSRGAHLARRIGRKIESIAGSAPSLGVGGVVVGGVINPGRPMRAALEMLGHIGKPKKILVATLVDRGDRELPIRADIVGKNVKVGESERVNVRLQESDGADLVTVTAKK